MLIRIVAPAILPLGLVQIESEGRLRTCLMGMTLEYPSVHLSAQAHSGLEVTGARASKAREQAECLLSRHPRWTAAQVEIEYAIPSLVGLGSDAMLGLSVARALALANGQPTDDSLVLGQALGLGPEDTLAVWGFHQGGLLFVETLAAPGCAPVVVRRHEIAHEPKDDWIFALHLPRIPQGTPPTLESDRLGQLFAAAPCLSAQGAGLYSERLLPALERDDAASFAEALMAVQEQNSEALIRAGTPAPILSEDQAVLDFMRDHGALACGRSAGGLGVYGLVKGASASMTLRADLRDYVGPFGGIVTASITDNRGAYQELKEENLTNY